MQVYHGAEQTLDADTFFSILQADYESIFLTNCIIEGAIVFSTKFAVETEEQLIVDKEIVCIRCEFKKHIQIRESPVPKRGFFWKFGLPRCCSLR